MNNEVDAYIGRSKKWPEEIAALRPILLGCGLAEHIKWGKPCYCHGDANIVIVQEMKHFLALMFFKGALLSDPEGVLERQGPNSRSARRITFTSVAGVERLASTVDEYLHEAIEVEDAGLDLGPTPPLVLCEELQRRLDDDPALAAAFETLTPGRRREYNLHISSAKKSTTRAARIDKHVPHILAGRGLSDRRPDEGVD